MNLINPFRDTLQRIPQLNDALDLILAKINALWSVEHDGEGHHTSITASGTITATGDITSVGNVVAQVGTDAEAQLGALENIGAEPIERGIIIGGTSGYEVIVRGVNPPGVSGEEVAAFHLARDADKPVWRIVYLPFDSAFHLMPYKGPLGGTILGVNNLGDRFLDAHFLDAHHQECHAEAGYTERGYAARMGEWTGVTFNAASFTASGGGTWTLTIADQTTFAYTLVGLTMIVSFFFDATSVAAAGTTLSVTIPGGFSAARTMMNPLGALLDNGIATPGFALVAASGTQINFLRLDGAAFTNSVNLTYVRGQLSFEVM